MGLDGSPGCLVAPAVPSSAIIAVAQAAATTTPCNTTPGRLPATSDASTR